MKLVLPATLQDQISHEAKAAYPLECCGLIEGVEEAGGFRATALHLSRNLAAAADRFDLDPVDHIAALKAARARGNGLIGCYHSHPDGDAMPSQADQSGAAQENFIWLIAATDGAGCQLAGFVYRGPGFEELVPISAIGADLVTSSLNARM